MAYIYRDLNGQAWEVIVNTDGSLSTVAVTLPTVGIAGQDSTITVQSVVNYASTHTELMPIIGVGGYSNEPAMSLANDTLRAILKPPFAWKFNRGILPLLVLGQNRQDYNFGGAAAFTLKGASVIGGVGIALASNSGITESGNTVTVNTLDPHNFSVGDVIYMNGNTVAAYNSTETITALTSTWSGGWTVASTPTATSFTFAHASSGLATSGAPGIDDFGWLESATMVDENSTSSPRFIYYVKAERSLQPNSTVGIPDKINATSNGDGTLRIRCSVANGTTAFGVSLVYQGKAPMLVNLTDTFAPVTDEHADIVRQYFLAKAFRYAGSARAENEFKRAEYMAMQALRHDDAEASDEFISPSESLMGGW